MFKKYKNILWTYWFCSLSKFFWIKSLLKPQNQIGKTHTYVHQILIKGPTKPVSKCILKQSRSSFHWMFLKVLTLSILISYFTYKRVKVCKFRFLCKTCTMLSEYVLLEKACAWSYLTYLVWYHTCFFFQCGWFKK